LDNHPTVSVIIPTYNRDWVLKEAIDSVLSQEFDGVELIVVDDGSTDSTAALLAAYGRSITTIHQSNAGVSAARNRGAAAATGRWLSFLDSDDLWLPQKLQRQTHFLDTQPQARICQTEEIWIRNGKRVNPKRRHKKPSGWIFHPSLSLCLVSPSAVMLEKALFEEMGGFDETLPVCEDYDLWLRISYRYPIFFIDEPLIVKRGGHPDQLSSTPGMDRYRIRSLEKILQTEPLTEDQREAAIRKLHEKCSIYAGGCLKRGRREEADAIRETAARFDRS
jgi:glycosyltransferase involved in cell wall biosynthesis